MKLSIIIPVFNEEDHIASILNKVSLVKVEKEVIIVDDFSTDKSFDVIKEEVKKHSDITHLQHKENMGKGASIRTAQPYVSGDYIIIQDADLEYDPNDYTRLLDAIKGKSKTVVYGSRFLNRDIRITRIGRISNAILNIITNLMFGIKLTDMETCYKLIPADLFKSIRLESNRFDFEPEITSKILKAGYKIIEIPISYTARSKEEGKKITWKDGVQALYKIIKYRFI